MGKRDKTYIFRDFWIDDLGTPSHQRLYYNSLETSYIPRFVNVDATYRLYRIKYYMDMAGENNKNYLNAYKEITTTVG